MFLFSGGIPQPGVFLQKIQVFRQSQSKQQRQQVIGQFLKRARHLFFRLKKSSIGQCALIYTFPSDPAEKRTFEFHEGEDKLLGEFNEFVISNTIQGMLAAIKRFQIFMKRKEEENTGENYKDLV